MNKQPVIDPIDARNQGYIRKRDGYVYVLETFLDGLIEDVMVPEIEKEHICGHHHVKDGFEKAMIHNEDIDSFESILHDMIDNHVNMAADNVDTVVQAMNDRKDFMAAIEPHYNYILNGGNKAVDDLTQRLYFAGKMEGFKQMDVAKFFGSADYQALKAIQDYHFGLIVNMATDLRMAIRDEVFKGVMEGNSIPKIASAIRDLNIQPINAGGRLLSPYQRATLIARTETARATMQGNMVAMQNYGVELFEWSDSGDERECDDCEALAEGGPYTIDEIPDYPAHPDCRCDLIASLEANIAGEPANPDDFLNLVTMDSTAVDDSIAESMGAIVEDDGSVAVDEPEDLNPMSKHGQSYMNAEDNRYAPMAKWGEDINNVDQQNINSAIFDSKGKQVGNMRDGAPLNYMDKKFLQDMFNPETGEGSTWVETKPNVHNWHLYNNRSFNPDELSAMIKGEVPEAISHDYLGEQWIVNIPDDVMSDIRASSFEEHWQLGRKIGDEFETIYTAMESQAVRDLGLRGSELDAYVEGRLPLIWNQVLPKYGIEYTHLDQVDIVRLLDTLPEAASPVADAGVIEEGEHPFPDYQSDRSGDTSNIYSREYYSSFNGRDPRNWEAGEYEPLPDELATNQPDFLPFSGIDDAYTQAETPEIDMEKGFRRLGGGMNSPVKVTDVDGRIWVVKRSEDAEARMEVTGWRVAQALDQPAPNEVIIETRAVLEETQPELVDALEYEMGRDENAAVFLEYIPDSETASAYQVENHLDDLQIAQTFEEDNHKNEVNQILLFDADGHGGNMMIAIKDDEERLFTIDNGLFGGDTYTYHTSMRADYFQAEVHDAVENGYIDASRPETIKGWIEDNLSEYIQKVKDMDLSNIPNERIPWVKARQANIDNLAYYWVKFWAEMNPNTQGIWR